MFLEADEELENIAAECRHYPQVLELRTQVYAGLKKWELMKVVSLALIKAESGNPQGHITLAYAMRRLHSLEAAREILTRAVQLVGHNPTVHFNLACYDCQLGDLASAKSHLETACRLWPEARAMALDEPDLESLWDSLKVQL
ncbi:MAG: hypothetical protein QM796_20325 [Chthoniobacteraceae bacterium]